MACLAYAPGNATLEEFEMLDAMSWQTLSYAGISSPFATEAAQEPTTRAYALLYESLIFEER